MKEKFNKQDFEKFKKYFKIKENQSEIEKNYFKRAYKYINYIKWIPGIRMIGIGNSISMNCSNKNSDIDLYIVTSKNSMWFVRIIITLVFEILKVRKTDKKHANMFCLSFFSTRQGMGFDKFKIDNDIYLYFWTLYFKPILSYNSTYELFLEKNNWADFSEYKSILEYNNSFIKFKGNKKEESFLIKYLNKIFKKIFLAKTLKSFEKIGKPYGVIINENILKFHNGDIRKQIKKELL